MKITIKTTGFDEVLEMLDAHAAGCEHLSSRQKQMGSDMQSIVEDSNFVEPEMRMIEGGNKLSKTKEAAKHEARYLAARKHQPFDESQSTQSELSEVSNEIVDRYIRDYLNRVFGGGA